jgi:hypothetical protein
MRALSGRRSALGVVEPKKPQDQRRTPSSGSKRLHRPRNLSLVGNPGRVNAVSNEVRENSYGEFDGLRRKRVLVKIIGE